MSLKIFGPCCAALTFYTGTYQLTEFEEEKVGTVVDNGVGIVVGLQHGIVGRPGVFIPSN